jgi:hypothetical protein
LKCDITTSAREITVTEIRNAGQVPLAANTLTVGVESNPNRKTARRSHSVTYALARDRGVNEQFLPTPVQPTAQKHKPALAQLLGIGAVVAFIVALLWIAMKFPLM